MIEAFYENPNKPKQIVTSYTNYTGGYRAQANGFAEAYNLAQAAKKKITPEEFIRRDLLVQKEAKRIILLHGDIVEYGGTDPKKIEEEKGKKYRVMKLYRNYSDFDPDPDWADDDARWVVAVRECTPEGAVSLASATYYRRAPL